MEGLERLMSTVSLDFYKNKRVFITGHTGFKGSWLCRILLNAGAKVYGYALNPPTNPNLYLLADLDGIRSTIGDIRDFEMLQMAFREAKPEIVFHLAAQPIVRTGYEEPAYTYETNVMGTVNILECVRQSSTVKSFLNVTTDKVYLNVEREEGYVEDEELDGFDPYSNSKSCSELVTHCYKNSFFADGHVAISTARAGNVIGGGDFSKDRIVPDCFRAASKNEPIIVRNKHSVRPYQHVLEPLFAYLMIAGKQYEDDSYSGWYNVGPDDSSSLTTGELATMFCKYWGDGAEWIDRSEANAPHEAGLLRLNCEKLKNTFAWNPVWDAEKAVDRTVEWYKAFSKKEDVVMLMNAQIEEYQGA